MGRTHRTWAISSEPTRRLPPELEAARLSRPRIEGAPLFQIDTPRVVAEISRTASVAAGIEHLVEHGNARDYAFLPAPKGLTRTRSGDQADFSTRKQSQPAERSVGSKSPNVQG